MACKYIYKGHIFDSELALDDFLLETDQYESVYGDIVFSMTKEQTPIFDILKRASAASNAENEAYRKWRNENNNKQYSEDGDEVIDQPPYMGVNKFLSTIEIEGKLLYPEFREKSYWQNRFDSWRKGEYTKSELEIFEFDENNTPKITSDMKDADGSRTIDKMQEKIKFKWESQAKSGNAIHNVLQLFFSKTKDISGNEVNVYDLENPKEWILDNLDKKYSPYLSNVDSIIEYARNLKQKLQDELNDDNLIFFPEYLVSKEATNPDSEKTTKLIGIVDLVILDSKGRVHILDYKTSIKDYIDFDSTKQLAYQYQMALYQRMLELYGININSGLLLVAPIKINNFRLDEDKYIYDGVTSTIEFDRVNTQITPERWNKIDTFMPAPFKFNLSTSDLHQEVETILNKWSPNYSSTKLVSEKWIVQMLKGRDLLKKNENGEFVYKPYGSSDPPIVSTEEADFVQQVLKYEQSLPSRRLRATNAVKIAFEEAIQKETPEVDWPRAIQKKTGVSATWLKDTLSPYCNGRWTIDNNSPLEQYGILMLSNKDTKQKDIIRISTNALDYNSRQSLDTKDPNRNRLSLLSAFEEDVIEASKSGSLMLEGVNGNVELMEIMAILNCTNGLEGFKIGNVKVINPYHYNSISASNEELLYCFNALNDRASMKWNQFQDGRIKFCSKYELALNKFNDIMAYGDSHNWKDAYVGFKSFQDCTSILDETIKNVANVEDKIEQLTKLLDKLKSSKYFGDTLERNYENQNDLNRNEVALHNLILTAIADLKGINFRQQLKNHDKWVEHINVFKHGLSGLYLDNPGNLNSETLNLVTSLVTEAYQNTRDEMASAKVDIQKLVNKLKESKGFNYGKENIGFNQVDLYKNLFVETPEGDLLFKNINAIVDPIEKELLEYALYNINKNRFPNISEEEHYERMQNYDTEYYRVPLAMGSSDSTVSSRGLLSLLREKLSNLNPSILLDKARKKAEGIYYGDDDAQVAKSEVLFRMTNMFDKGEETTEKRLQAIRTMGIENAERNLETLLLKHQFAYAQQRNINQVFPLIRAAMVHLSQQGAMRNTTLKQDVQWLSDYITNKIQNRSITDPKLQKAKEVTSMLKKAAAFTTLAFSPMQMLYQPLQGLWTDIRLYFQQKYQGQEGSHKAFSFQHFNTALKMVYSDLIDVSGKPTLFSLVNEIYGINDMDMNTYVDRITKNKKGFWNMDNFAMKFATRPDFYNRMTIFASQMLQDGCLEAHSVEDGRLKYDWTKDKRFSKFASDPTSKSQDPEFIKQKTLYYTVAKQFVKEHARNFDGTEFKLDMNKPMALPRAYTNQQAEGMKSLADDIYGYYSHEKKSMVMSTFLGSMWLQFKTFWSGKKNQYLQSGGVRMKGEWKQATRTEIDPETGKTTEVGYYYQVDADGNILFDQPPTTEKTIAPVMQWKGQWQEGILLTLGDIFAKTAKDPKHFLKHIKDKWDKDDINLQNCYRSNLVQLQCDLMLWTLGGILISGLLSDWLKDLKDDNKQNRDFFTGVGLAAANVGVMSVKSSFMDFNFMESIGAPVGSWTPFAFDWTARQYKQIVKIGSGDEDIWDGIVKMSSTGKAVKPVFDALKPDRFRTKQEGGTWESATARRNRERKEGN